MAIRCGGLPVAYMVAPLAFPNHFGVSVGFGAEVVAAISLTVATSVPVGQILSSRIVHVSNKLLFAAFGAWVLFAASIKGIAVFFQHGVNGFGLGKFRFEGAPLHLCKLQNRI